MELTHSNATMNNDNENDQTDFAWVTLEAMTRNVMQFLLERKDATAGTDWSGQVAPTAALTPKIPIGAIGSMQSLVIVAPIQFSKRYVEQRQRDDGRGQEPMQHLKQSH